MTVAAKGRPVPLWVTVPAMCGIAGFVTGDFGRSQAKTGWLGALSAQVTAAPEGLDAVDTLQKAVEMLEKRFADLMSFATGTAVAFDGDFRAGVRSWLPTAWLK